MTRDEAIELLYTLGASGDRLTTAITYGPEYDRWAARELVTASRWLAEGAADDAHRLVDRVMAKVGA